MFMVWIYRKKQVTKEEILSIIKPPSGLRAGWELGSSNFSGWCWLRPLVDPHTRKEYAYENMGPCSREEAERLGDLLKGEIVCRIFNGSPADGKHWALAHID